MNGILVLVEIPHELDDAVLEVKLVRLLRPFVDEFDHESRIQERQFAQALGENVILELTRRFENLGIRFESDLGPGLLRLTDHLHLLCGLTLCKTHLVHFAIAANLGLEPFRNRIHALRTNAM